MTSSLLTYFRPHGNYKQTAMLLLKATSLNCPYISLFAGNDKIRYSEKYEITHCFCIVSCVDYKVKVKSIYDFNCTHCSHNICRCSYQATHGYRGNIRLKCIASCAVMHKEIFRRLNTK